VFIPTLVFRLATHSSRALVASGFLIAALMRMVGKIALWKSLAHSIPLHREHVVTFDIAFDVIMPRGRRSEPSDDRETKTGSLGLCEGFASC